MGAWLQGIVKDKLFRHHRVITQVQEFMSPLVIIANPLTPAAGRRADLRLQFEDRTTANRASGGCNPVDLFNVGDAKIYGTDIGVRT